MNKENRPLKMVIISFTFNIGSEGYTSYDFAKGLIANGAIVHAIVNRLGEGVDINLFSGVNKLNLNPRRKGSIVLFNLISDFLALFLALAGYRIVHGTVSNHFFITSIISRKRFFSWGPALIQSDLIEYGDENLLIYGAEPNTFKTIPAVKHTKKDFFLICYFTEILSYLVKKTNTLILRRFSLLLAANSYTYDKLHQINPNTVLIPECVDTCFFEYTDPPNENRLLTYGVMLEHEGHEFAIRSLPKILQTFPNVSLTILGDGPRRAYLEQLVKNIGVNNHVKFMGYVNRNEVKRQISQAKIIILSSLVEEGGISQKECLSAGRPIVASKVRGHIDDIIDGQTGYLVTPGNYEEIAEAVIKLLKDKHQVYQMSKNARKIAIDLYDCQVTAKNYILNLKITKFRE